MKKHKRGERPAKSKSPKKKLTKKQKILIILSSILILAGGAVAIYFIFFNKPAEEPVTETTPAPIKEAPKYYSKLTGEEIAKGADEAPLYCIQTPNGLDGARPQVGLTQAKIIFEAIAEAGITRFAAIYQSPDGSVIGPIRSLRTYYLDWDTPFGCTVVHAGGSDEAIAALRSGDYREVDEGYNYTFRDYSTYIAPNNLFTSSELLQKNSEAYGYTKSNYTAWPRLLPDEAAAEAKKLTQPSAESSSDQTGEKTKAESESATPTLPLVDKIILTYGGYANFNPVYTYNKESNKYLRSYASGEPHQSYNCPSGLTSPVISRDCTLEQLSPSVVIAMKAVEYLDWDGYHHVIKTIGSGEAVVFQNGTAIPATWQKSSRDTQITFTDKNGSEIKLTPGQTWLTILPQSGTITY